MNLIEQIAHYIAHDDEDIDAQSIRLADVYRAADAAGKALLDEAFICLCGYSLATLIS